jgi:hypothetical protein
MQYNVHITMKSGNSKVGRIPVSTTSAVTCPSVCPFNHANEGGCYANAGPLAMHWAKVTDGNRGDTWSVFVGKIANLKEGQLWRHNQAGDLAGDGKRLDAKANFQLSEANKGKRGWTYTHYDVLNSKHNANVVQQMNGDGFVVNLSGNNLAHADDLYDLGIAPVTTVLPSDQLTNTTTPKGRKVVVCPAVVKDDVSCEDCGLCARLRDAIVGFPAHGTGKKKADAVASA